MYFTSKSQSVYYSTRGWLREIICFECDLENMRLGGLGEVVTIDESKFMKTQQRKRFQEKACNYMFLKDLI